MVEDKAGEGIWVWVLATQSVVISFFKVWGEFTSSSPLDLSLKCLWNCPAGSWKYMRLPLGLLAKIKCRNAGPELRSNTVVVTWSRSSVGEAKVTQGDSINASENRRRPRANHWAMQASKTKWKSEKRPLQLLLNSAKSGISSKAIQVWSQRFMY